MPSRGRPRLPRKGTSTTAPPDAAILADADADADRGTDTDDSDTDDSDTDDIDTDRSDTDDSDTDDSDTDDSDTDSDTDEEPTELGQSWRRHRSLPTFRVSLTAVVAGVLVLLIGLGSWLLATRPVGQSPIELTAFGEILSAARSGVVDVTSFDYLTLDQDLAEIDEVTTGDLHDEVIATLTDRREQLVTDQQVSSTEVIAASVTEATATRATALVVLRARQKSLLTPQETVTRYRVEVRLILVEDRWLLSGLMGS